MNKLMLMSCSLIILTLTCKATFAEGKESNQLQMLNSQIQGQLQKIQANQQEQLKDFNKQIQTQLKQMHTELQGKMQELNEKMKKLQSDTLKQIQSLADSIGAVEVTPVADPAKQPAPAKPAPAK